MRGSVVSELKGKVIFDQDIEFYLSKLHFDDYSIEEGRLMLLELLSKAGAGCYNSHTEESFLSSFGLLKKDRTPNKKGLRFIMSMVYASSNQRPQCFNSMNLYRS